jgi:type IV pilus assembly protein PilN
MIRINLLPFRAARTKENIKRQISVFILTILFVFSVMGYYFLNLNSRLSDLRADKAAAKKELSKYKGIDEKLKRIQRQIQETRAKLNVIKDLEKKKTGPVQMLDEISLAVPKDKLWLTALQEKGGNLTLKGTAMDNETVALFMTNLEKAKHIKAVDLKSTKLGFLKQYGLHVSEFILECRTYSHNGAPPPKKGRRSRRR